MRTIEEVRRARLAELLRDEGSYVKLNERLGRGARDSTLSQIANQSVSNTGSKKTMGSEMARAIEEKFHKPRGWMDTDPDIWPFADIDHAKVVKLLERHRAQLEGALLVTAAGLGLDIGKRIAA